MEVFTLPLSESGEPIPSGQGQLIKLPPPSDNPYILRFVIFSASEIVNKGIIHCNVPPPGVEFNRFKYYPHPIKANFHNETQIDIVISSSGAFSYFITFLPVTDPYFNPDYVEIAINTQNENSDDFYEQNANLSRYSLSPTSSSVSLKNLSKTTSSLEISEQSSPADSSQYLAVPQDTSDVISLQEEPTQKVRNEYLEDVSRSCTNKFYFTVSAGFKLDGQPLSLNSLNIQSVVSKWMGPQDTWKHKLELIKEKGYNMIHFTPLQERGQSNSPYSIYDQLVFDPGHFPNGEKDVADLVFYMEHNLKLLSMTDIVFNHTANNSDWLKDHPEAGYSSITAPHLNPAIDLDNSLLEFSDNLKTLGYPTFLYSMDDLYKIMEGIKSHVLPMVKLWEYYVVDVEAIKREVLDNWGKLSSINVSIPDDVKADLKKLARFTVDYASVGFDHFGHARFKRSLDKKRFIPILIALLPNEPSLDDVAKQATSILNEVNLPLYQEYDADVNEIQSQLFNRINFTRLDPNGPKFGEINHENPLIETYFTHVKTRPVGKVVELANNGWIWNGNPLIDFASEKSKAYLRREVIIWGDCVKLRYGNHPSESPYLWDRMTKYTQLLAKYFHGFRVDNCHSTPLHVGEYFLDKARLVRSNLYVAAELFTGSEDTDRIFVERLGITSLIREAMQAWSVEELSRLVHRHGGRPIGSFSKQPVYTYEKFGTNCESLHLVRSSSIHALFMDCTHDNLMPAQKRTVEDTLPNAALVSMCACSVGSVMGYDEGYPKLLEIVTEKREYTFGGGITKIKRILSDVHTEMGQLNANEMHVHHEGQYITVHRINSRTGEGWFLVARTKFGDEGYQRINDISLKGITAECHLSVALKRTGDPKYDPEFITGIPTEVVELDHPTIKFDEANDETTISFNSDFPQGSIVLLRTSIRKIDKDLDTFVRTGADEAIANMDLLDLNIILYRCDSEERDSSGGADGVYDIPNYGELKYAGLVGWMQPLLKMINDNNLAHLICEHLRDGLWALDYSVNRLYKYEKQFPNIRPYIDWLKSRFDAIRELPPFMIPRYFALIKVNAFIACRNRCFSLASSYVSSGTFFLQLISLTSVQMVGKVPSTSLVPFKTVGSMAAGLPFFSHDYMRCWGRDVFISLRGLLICVGRHEEAKQHILSFAATLKHGLIPNLLDAGRNPRYNARDATWFFTQVLQEYANEVPDGYSIFNETVKRRFPLNDDYVPIDDPRAFSETSTIAEIYYEILARHAKGIEFREANAGPNLDSQMKDEGFNQKIYVDWSTGFVFGGNEYNCGTWMDKMGESEKAGNKGFPGTPRTGAAVEITGLLKSTVRFAIELSKKGILKHDYVVNQHGDQVTFQAWNDKIQETFECAYYVPLNADDDSNYDIDRQVVHRRGIYKDLYRSTNTYEDYQLRPNFTIAMVVAPELFVVDHAINAIAMADQILRGPVGMATLDPDDLNYRPYYNNSEDSTDFQTAKGRNYHQGPEWVWCTGYFLRAFLKFDILKKQQDGYTEESLVETFQQISRRLNGHREWLRSSPWFGLTELTNKNGQFCQDSSPTQAWSTATLIDLFRDSREYTSSFELF